MTLPNLFQRFAALAFCAAIVLGVSSGAWAATSITQFGITWTFDRDYPTGRFANGDYWVVGPVTITSISPKSTDRNGVMMHGSMINPIPDQPHGFDSRVRNNRFDPKQNVAQSFPLQVPAGSSLLSSESYTGLSKGNDPQLKTIAVLTVLARPAPAGSFRPPYAGTDKTIRWNKSQLDYSQLRSVPKVAGMPSLREVESMFERPFIDIRSSYSGTYLQPKENHPAYGREISHQVAAGLLSLQLNYSNRDKETLLIRMVQRGIDIYGLAQDGAHWNNDGGHRHGRKPVLMLAGVALNDKGMLSWGNAANKFIFQEDQQTWYVTLADVGRALKTRDGRSRLKYTLDLVGLPEWGGRHIGEPEGDAAQWDCHYRDVCGASMTGTVLAMRMMGLEKQWNWPAWFDYMDRFYKVERSNVGTSPNRVQPYVAAMWEAYRHKSAEFDEENTSVDQVWQNTRVAAQTGAFTSAFDMIPSQDKMEGITGLSLDPAQSESDLAASVRFAPNGFIEAANGATFQAAERVPYKAGVKYRVVIAADLQTDKYSVTVTPQGGEAARIASDWSFRNEQRTLAKVANVAFVSKTGAHAVLNATTTAQIPPVVSPSPARPSAPAKPDAPASPNVPDVPDASDTPAENNTLASVLRINAGGTRFTDADGQVWSADEGFDSGMTQSVSTRIEGTSNQRLYQTHRYDNPRSKALLNYQWRVPNGTYRLRLHFAENEHRANRKRQFDVKAENRVVVSKLDIHARVGAHRALVVESEIEVKDGNLDLQFLPGVGNPQIAGVEVLRSDEGKSPKPGPRPATPDTPPDAGQGSSLVRINVGGDDYRDERGLVWSADRGFDSGMTQASDEPIAGTNDDRLFQTNRFDNPRSKALLNYSIEVPNADYVLRLLFAETEFTANGRRRFDVSVEGRKVLSKFDIHAQGGAKRAVVMEVPVKVADGRLDLQFLPDVGNPVISGIEVVSTSGRSAAAPGSPTPSAPAQSVDEAISLVRINAGAGSVTDRSGQRWTADRGFDSGMTKKVDQPIAGTADASLFQSFRYDNPRSAALLNYSIPVDNADYTVRLMFAETEHEANRKRRFDVVAEGRTVIDGLDIHARVGANHALVVDVPVTVADGQLDLGFVNDIGSPMVNAIEVLAR